MTDEAHDQVPDTGPIPGSAEPPANTKPLETPSLFQLVKSGEEQKIKQFVTERIAQLAAKHNLNNYKIVFLFDYLDSISDYHADRIYSAISEGAKNKDILLVIQSRGGKIEPAFLISKTCKKLSHGKFSVAIPRKAKSAATLIALGADEIHMGMMSQLGPIDPQINDLPALGLANGLVKITQLACDYPKSAEMWSKYLSENLSLRHLGYLERLGESATQYAERLLKNKTFPNSRTAQSVGDHFVNHYKDHSFLIDVDEATSLLGAGMVRTATPEYAFANEVYQELDMLEFLLKYLLAKEFYLVGAISPDSIVFRDREKDA